jgi:hypothetical protein
LSFRSFTVIDKVALSVVNIPSVTLLKSIKHNYIENVCVRTLKVKNIGVEPFLQRCQSLEIIIHHVAN